MAKNLRAEVLDIALKTIQNILPDKLIPKELRKIDFKKYKNIYIIGAGKGASKMAEACENLLKGRITAGHINIPEGEKEPALKYIQFSHASHPLPNYSGVKGAKKILKIVQKAEEGDLVIGLISGGGSALMPLPVKKITLEEKIKTTSELLKCGANIHEINTIRKHLSQIKGGFLAKAAFPADVLVLVISDVLGDDLSVIASGPFAADNSTFIDALTILNKYKILNTIPVSVKKYLSESKTETPKKGDVCFKKVKHVILANHETAAKEAYKIAKAKKLNPKVLDTHFEGECRKKAVELIKKIKGKKNLFIVSGETTVKIKGTGKGGRNQEFVLAAINEISKDLKKYRDFVVLSIGTDGVDGICPVKTAGAIATEKTLIKAKKLKLNIQKFLNNNDSYNFFKKNGDLIITGPTGTNLGDLIIIFLQ